MTETLAEKTCTPCRGGVPPLARDEVLRFQSQAPEWVLRDDARRIERMPLSFIATLPGNKHCPIDGCGRENR